MICVIILQCRSHVNIATISRDYIYKRHTAFSTLIKVVCISTETVSWPTQNNFETEIWDATHRLRNTPLWIMNLRMCNCAKEKRLLQGWKCDVQRLCAKEYNSKC